MRQRFVFTPGRYYIAFDAEEGAHRLAVRQGRQGRHAIVNASGFIRLEGPGAVDHRRRFFLGKQGIDGIQPVIAEDPRRKDLLGIEFFQEGDGFDGAGGIETHLLRVKAAAVVFSKDIAAHRANRPPAVIDLVKLGEQAVFVLLALGFRVVQPGLQAVQRLVDQVLVVDKHQGFHRLRDPIQRVVHAEGIDGGWRKGILFRLIDAERRE